ncbi:MAG TPA: MarR family winged helix-turn-helix transcriptional regulator [Polyangiaceae bacterium]|nr:MarR family winged helix-turn-helix transcriptional regulator [Polyangiaceae bacterium]
MSSANARKDPRSPAPTVEEAHAAIAVLARLSELYQERRAQLAESVGLSDQQWGVLEEIATEHFMPSLFARRRESSAAAVSKILRQLSEKGLVVAAIAKGDGRQRTYSLTAKGRKVMAELRKGRQDAVAEVWLALPAPGLESFTELGKELIARLERYAATQDPER